MISATFFKTVQGKNRGAKGESGGRRLRRKKEKTKSEKERWRIKANVEKFNS